MKKILLSIIALVVTIAANAATVTESTLYHGKLAISITGDTPDMEDASDADITVNKMDDDTYTFVLNKFSFMQQLIGDATVSGIKGEESDGTLTLSATDAEAPLTNGGAIATMIGGKVVMTMTATIKDGKLSADISKITVNMPTGAINVKALFESTSSETGISTVKAGTAKTVRVYDLSGRQLTDMQKGLNIVKTNDGKTVKIIK